MSEILIHQNLPFVDIKVASENVTPLQALNSHDDNDYYLMTDGSHCIMYEMDELSIPEISQILLSLSHQMSVQIYKLKTTEKTYNYICIRKSIDYSFLKISWKYFLESFFAGPSRLMTRLRTTTTDTVKEIKSLATQSLRVCNLQHNGITKFLYEPGFKIKTNLGLVKTGRDQYVSSFSVNNIATLPMVRNVLDGIEYLQVISYIRPSLERERALKLDAIDKAVTISALASKNHVNNVQVHTLVDSDEYIQSLSGGLLYCNSKYIMRSQTIDSLNQKIKNAEGKMAAAKIVVYNHTVSGQAEFISAFPGNVAYGEHYYTLIQSFAPMLTHRLINI